MAFNPNLSNWFPVEKFRFWCQKVLPLVYDDSLSYYEILCKVVEYLNKYGEDLGVLAEDYKALVEYVNNYFESDMPAVIKQYVDEWLDEHPEATTTVQDHSLGYQKLINGTLGFVSYKMFGATCDGVTDDYEAIKACHDFANAENLPVINDGITFAVATNHAEPITVKTSCFFKKSTINVLGNTSNYILFDIINDEVETEYNRVPLSTFFSDLNTATPLVKDKFLTLTFPYSRGLVSNEATPNREAFGAVKKIWSVKTYDGNAIVDGVVSNLNQHPITFSGLNINIAQDKIYGQVVRCRRHNTTIHDIDISYKNASAGVSYGAVIRVYSAYNVKVFNVSYLGYTQSHGTYRYAVRFDLCVSCSIERFCGLSSWHAFVAFNITDFVMRDCDTERFDTHSGLFGSIVIERCNFSSSITLGYGWGNCEISNCHALRDLVIYRDDSALCYNGTIRIDKCECSGDYYLFNSNTVSDTTGIDNIFKTTEKRIIIIDTTGTRCWRTMSARSDFHGTIHIKIFNATYAYCGGTADTNETGEIVEFYSCYIPSIGGKDTSISYYAYDSTYKLTSVGNSMEIHDSKIICDISTVQIPKLKAFNCAIEKTENVTTSNVANVMLIDCVGLLIAGRNMLVQGGRYNSAIGYSSMPQTGGILFATATNGDILKNYTNIETKYCYDSSGVVQRTANGLNFVDF